VKEWTRITNPLVEERVVNGGPEGHYQCRECKAFDYEHRVECSQMKRFPIQGGGFIPWWLAEIAYEEYHDHHNGQDLARLAERGGFGIKELVSLIRKEW
jgi:hypothetical protein